MSCNNEDRQRRSADDERRDAEQRAADDACLLPLRPKGCTNRFEDSTEWKWTKKTCAGLFRALGRYYDELWFPTVINEWCSLYYQCNHSCDYWQRRDEWLAGDDQIRVAVWSQVLDQRTRRDRLMRDACTDDDVDKQRRTVDPTRIMEMRRTLDRANDRIVMKRMKRAELACHDQEQPTAEEVARAETEAAEIALADPSEDPNWVDMRRRMRGAFAALNLARCDVSGELLTHLMIELCNHWRNLPCVDHQIEPLLLRNIMREVRNFRYKLFGKPVAPAPPRPCEPEQPDACPHDEPERPDACPRGEPERPDACPRGEPERPDACPRGEPERPDACQRGEPERPDACRRGGPEECAGPAPAQRPCSARPKKPKTRPCSRGPATNKLVEARAKLTAARMKAFEEKNK